MKKVKFSDFDTMKHPNLNEVFVCDVVEDFSMISSKDPFELIEVNFELNQVFINLVSQHRYGGAAEENFHAHIVRLT